MKPDPVHQEVFAFVQVDSRVRQPGILPGGSGGCFVLVTIATGPGLGSPVQEGGLGSAAAGESPPPQSPRMWVQPLRPLPGAFLSLSLGPAHKTFVSSPQGPCGGQGPCFAREETEAQGRMGAYKLGP